MNDTSSSQKIPEFGMEHEPIYSGDNPTVVHEKVRVFLTHLIHQHEQKFKGGTDGPDEDSLPCLSLSIPCYMSGVTPKDYGDALTQPAHILSALNDEAAKLGYVPLGVTPAVFGTPDSETYQNATDRAPGWRVELTAVKNIEKFFDDPEHDHLMLTRLWLELSVKSHGPAYQRAMQHAKADEEAQTQLQRIMAGDFRA